MTAIRKRGVFAGFLIAAVLLAGCGERQESPVQQQAPAAQPSAVADDGGQARQPAAHLGVTLLPDAPTVNDELQTVVRGGSGSLSFAWQRNGEAIAGQAGSRLPDHSFLKGETVTVTVRSGGEQAQASVTIVNTPPQVISVPFVDPYVHRGVDIVAEPQGVDDDGDPLHFRFRWSINGQEVIGNDAPLLAGDSFRKGDRIALTVIPVDDEGEGVPFNGGEIVVPNAPPVFVTTPALQFLARVYAYEARAEDPDGDPLAYSLEAAPPGMSIDSATGSIGWEIGQANSGEHHIRIVAQDEEGMRAIQEFTLNLSIPE